MMKDVYGYFVGLLLTYQAADISWPNVEYTGNTETFLQFLFTPSVIRAAGMGVYGYDERRGIVQINIVEPLLSGTATASDKAEALQALFHRGRAGVYNGTNITIEKTQINGAVVENDRYVVPVVSFWHSFTPPLGV